MAQKRPIPCLYLPRVPIFNIFKFLRKLYSSCTVRSKVPDELVNGQFMPRQPLDYMMSRQILLWLWILPPSFLTNYSNPLRHVFAHYHSER